MRKQTKLIAALSATALLALGASMTSFAASGWQEENGVWMWYDNNGDYVTDSWKKSGNQYFYLDENGEMATNMLVETDGSKYYVDANGARVLNQWVAVPNEDDWDAEVDTIYYYFGSTGKAYKDSKKTIGGKFYIFDEEGRALSGWQNYGTDNADLYYLGSENECWAYSGWQSLEPKDDITREDGSEYDDEEWFYFNPSNGKAHTSARKYINGHYYSFDDNSVMMDKWLVGTPATSTPYTAYYNEDIGNQLSGWVYTYAQEDKDQEEDQYWFYLNSKGINFNGQGEKAGANSNADKKNYNGADNWDSKGDAFAAKVIKSKTYLFNEKGQMQTGVFRLTNVAREGSSTDLSGIYYFNKNDGSVKGQMMTGKQTVEEEGDNYYYYFDKNGKAYTDSIADGTLYGTDGTRISADDGNSYKVITLGSTENLASTIKEKGKTTPLNVTGAENPSNAQLIVNKSGKVKQSGTVTIDGVKYTLKGYVVTESKNVD